MRQYPSCETAPLVRNHFNTLKAILTGKCRVLLLIPGLTLLAACSGGSGGANGGSGSGGLVNTNQPGGGGPVVTSKVSGTVLDKNGIPVPGVLITAYWNNEHTTVTATTDANGAYSIAGLHTGDNSDFTFYATKAGLGFYPSVGADGAVAREDFNGYYRTAIRFLSMPSHDVVNAGFTAFRSGDKQASLPGTGQTTSYASGDDYAVRAGVAWPGTRFTDNGDGTVTDHLTGLVWLKDAECFNPTDWSSALSAANHLASGACGLTDGSASGQWRMPNVNELESLVDVSRVNPAVSAGSPFTNIDLATAYWSSTTYTAASSNAMAIRFSDGRWINGLDRGFNNVKTVSANALWPVKSGAAGAIRILATGAFSGQGGGAGRSFGVGDDASLQLGAPLTDPRFIDNGNGTLSDTVTGLTWLKMADCINQSWPGALTAINGLASGQCGLADGSTAGQWRMPNRTEMLSLSDRAPTFAQANYFNGIPGADGTTVSGPVIFNNFKVSQYYWTSTTSAADTTEAWSVYSCDFGVYNTPKTDVQYALAVR